MIDLVPTQPTSAPFEWVSVEERLPTQAGRYLVIARGGYDIAFFRTNIVDRRFDRSNVTHWMPLPKRPDSTYT